jgi:phage terminase large subunit-like protein
MLVLPEDPADPIDVVYRFWIPQRPVEQLDEATGNKFSQWIREGWVTVAGDNVLDYEKVYEDIENDAANFNILGIDFDEFGTIPVAQEIMKRTGMDEETMELYRNSYERMSPGLEGVMGLALDRKFHHHANPVARWCFLAAEVRTSPSHPDLIRVEKPLRKNSGKRVDAVPATAMAFNAWKNRGDLEIPTSAYSGEDSTLLIV